MLGLFGVAAMPASATRSLDSSMMVGVGSENLPSCDFNDDVDTDGAGERAGGVKWAAMGVGTRVPLLTMLLGM